jgi:hypothetical protein
MHCERLHPNYMFLFVRPLGALGVPGGPVMQQPLPAFTLLLQGHNLYNVNHGQPFRHIRFTVHYHSVQSITDEQGRCCSRCCGCS